MFNQNIEFLVREFFIPEKSTGSDKLQVLTYRHFLITEFDETKEAWSWQRIYGEKKCKTFASCKFCEMYSLESGVIIIIN